MSKARCGVWMAIVALVVLVAAHTALRADVATPRPQWTAVQLVAEQVNITLGQQRVKVEATFQLQNTGSASTVRIGYPLGLFEKRLNDFAVAADGEAITDVKTQAGQSSAVGPRRMGVGGRPAKGVAAEPYRFQGPYKEWKVFSVPFGANEKKTVRVTYWVAPAQVTDQEKGALSFYCYTLKTGATWKGKIGKATIRVKLNGLPTSRLVRVRPAGWRRSTNGKFLGWTLTDFEPTDDIEITWRPTTVAVN